jgi:hypothetical protein
VSEVGKIKYEQSTSMVYTAVGLRDQMAMAAISGMLADCTRDSSPYVFAKYAYEIADAMLKARDE